MIEVAGGILLALAILVGGLILVGNAQSVGKLLAAAFVLAILWSVFG